MEKCNLGNGKSVLLWKDLWKDICLDQQFPHLVTFAKDVDITVSRAVLHRNYQDLFYLPLSQEAFNEFMEFEIICGQAELCIGSHEPDTWTYIWRSNEFSVTKAYQGLAGVQPCPPQFKWIWDNCCQQKHKVSTKFFMVTPS
jgi:hypothetical protein